MLLVNSLRLYAYFLLNSIEFALKNIKASSYSPLFALTDIALTKIAFIFPAYIAKKGMV